MSSQQLVSVIVPCYNYGHLLHDALDSLLSQTYQYWECLVIDDGSTDQTKKVAESFVRKDKRIQYIYQENKGLSSARNTGIKNARGKYLQLLDADDLLEPYKLSIHTAYLEEYPQVDLVYGDVILFEHNNHANRRKFQFQVEIVSGQKDKILSELVTDNFFLPGCPIFRRSLIDEIGDFNISLYALEDWHFWYRCALHGKVFSHINAPGTCLLSRSHDCNMSGSRKKMWYYKAVARKDLMSYSKKVEISNVISKETIRELHKWHRQHLYLDLLRYHMMFGNILEGMKTTLQYGIYSKRYYFAIYESAYWFKERLKILLYA